jgi:AraC-like DNA-binding protein
MNQLQKGQFYGQTNNTINLNGITLTDTEYTHDTVDWHYHQNPYITFILQGNLIEGNKKEIYNCIPSTLLFHNWEEPHYNIKPPGYARGFHIEIEQNWAKSLEFELQSIQGNMNISNPEPKLLLYKIFKETKINDAVSDLSIQESLLRVLEGILKTQHLSIKGTPDWVGKIKELLHDECADKYSLNDLSKAVGIHPGHLSRDFNKYFQIGLGDYIRKLKIEKSLRLLVDKKHSLADITFLCGFADQSHFSRCFKERFNISPSVYRKMLIG